jgi:hypothetical protein
MNLPLWLDTHLGPPWSGLALLALLGALSALSGYVGIRTVRWMFPLPEDERR